MKVINFEDGHCKRIRSYLDSYLNNWYKIHVAGIETSDHLAYVISTKSREGNERIAADLAPAVSGFLKKLEA